MDDWGTGSLSARAHFERAAPDLSDVDALRAELRAEFESDPQLVERWQTYCSDRRGSPAPAMKACKVWHYGEGATDEVVHDDRASACADYVIREAVWVLERRRVVP